MQTYYNNYGTIFTDELWPTVHIDHIIPISSASTEQEVIELQHYSNLQLLKIQDNLNKGNSLDWSIDE